MKPKNETQAHCEYIMRAKRVNVLPDAAELVFVDDTREVSNPTYPVWLHFLQHADWNPKLYAELCGSPVAQFPDTTFARPFTNVSRDGTRYLCKKPEMPGVPGCRPQYSDCLPVTEQPWSP